MRGGVADRVRRAIAELEFSPSPSKNGVTMSLGVASYPVDAVAPEALIRCADRAMYTAKAKGKNQTQLYGANRRALRRVRVELKGEIRVLNDKGVPFSTLNISERGLSLKAKEPLELNSMVEFVLDVPDRSEGIKAYGRVVRVYDKVDGAYEMALAIMDMDSREHLALTMFLRSQTSNEDDESERD